MKPLAALFITHRARSDIFSRYQPGDVPYIGNGLSDNAVVGIVTPKNTDRVFRFMGIAVSAFCEATVQAPPFVACGRAGNGLVVLEPRIRMTAGALAYFAGYLNTYVRWRFSWYWQTTATRLQRIPLPESAPDNAIFSVAKHVPPVFSERSKAPSLEFRPVALGDIYELRPGHYHNVTVLPAGTTPVVSCGNLNNGICGHFTVGAEHVYRNRLTIAFNGSTLTAKYHPYNFAAKDDVAVCVPKNPLRLSTELFVQMMLSRERWRFSYYRKCYRNKLERTTVPLPMKNGKIDENSIQEVMQTTPYWSFLAGRLGA